MVFSVDQNFVQSLRNAIRREGVWKFLAIFGEWEKSYAIAVWGTNQATVAAKAKLFDKSLAFVWFGWIIKHATSVLFDVWSSHVAWVQRDYSCVQPVWALSELPSAALVIRYVASPQIENFLGIYQRASQHRGLVGNVLNVIFVLSVLPRRFVVVVIGWRIHMNVRWVLIRRTIQVRLIWCAARFIACAWFAIITCVAAEWNDFWISFASVWRLIAEQVFLQNFWYWRLVVVAVKLLDVVNARPLGTLIVAVVSGQCTPPVRMNLWTKFTVNLKHEHQFDSMSSTWSELMTSASLPFGKSLTSSTRFDFWFLLNK